MPLRDAGWLVEAMVVRDNGAGLFEGEARIVNTAPTARVATMTFNVFVGEDSQEKVATLRAFVGLVPPGGRETVPLIGFTQYVDGPHSIVFNVETTF